MTTELVLEIFLVFRASVERGWSTQNPVVRIDARGRVARLYVWPLLRRPIQEIAEVRLMTPGLFWLVLHRVDGGLPKD